MLQINASTTALDPPRAAGAEPERLPGDGFEALLAGLMGIAVAPPVPLEPGRSLVLEPATTPDPDAEAADAGDATDPESTGADDGTDDRAPLARPAAPPLSPGAGPAATNTAPAPGEPAGPPPHANRAEPLLRAPVEPVPGAVQRPEGSSGAAPIAPPHPTAERQVPPTMSAAAKPEAMAGIRKAQAEPGRPDAARRLPPDAAGLRSAPADRPLPLGPLVAGAPGSFAQLTLQVERQEPTALDAGRVLPGLGAGPAPLDVITPEAAVARPAATPPVRQLAAAIERAIGGDVQRLTIQLSPQALGSIEIALELDPERRLAVVILAERPETLELLRNEARELQRLLAQQGIELADAGLELGLMGGERRGRQAPEDEAPASDSEGEQASEHGLAVPATGAEPHPLDRDGRNGRLNLSI